MIPVIGIPILNRGDLLLRCLRSIDYEVGRIFIIQNGTDPGVEAVLEQLDIEGELPITVDRPGGNLGCASSWNRIIDRNPGADYWLLVGNDIQFTPGDLRRIDQFVRAHPNYVVMPANHGHSLFAVTPAGVDRIGLFDENIFPAYCEDQDHMYRIQLANAPWRDVPEIRAIHGEAPTFGSHTIYADKALFERNHLTHRLNFDYYCRKWGGPPGKEAYLHPYNDPSLTLKDWRFDAAMAAANGRPSLT